MTVGSPTTNTLTAAKGHPGLRFVCLQNKSTRFPELPNFPTTKCVGGIMTVHHFPACWDGKNLDSDDHQSHMYNTQGEAFTNGGPCPASHPVRMPQVAYETLWDTAAFKDMWPADGSNPFVLSFNDQAGYGTHADYLFGWKGDTLQKAMDSSCMFNACENGKPLKSQSVAAMNKCAAKKLVQEDTDGCKYCLPRENQKTMTLTVRLRAQGAPRRQQHARHEHVRADWWWVIGRCRDSLRSKGRERTAFRTGDIFLTFRAIFYSVTFKKEPFHRHARPCGRILHSYVHCDVLRPAKWGGDPVQRQQWKVDCPAEMGSNCLSSIAQKRKSCFVN